MARPKDGYYLMYLRKSRADVERERYGRYETLSVHERELTALAKREGYPVAEVYRELVSGETVAARSEFQRVMARMQDASCRGVIVHAVDRLGRGDPMEYGWILSTFRWTHTLVITPGRVYDPTVADDIQQLKLQMFVANVEFDHIRERLREGSRRSAERGNYLGSRPPYGYDRAVIDRNHTIVPNDREAPVIRTMFEMAAGGHNKGEIARHLNEAGMMAREGGLWTPARIGTMLSNPVYKGIIRYGYRTTRMVSEDGRTFTKRITVSDEGDYVRARGIHEPLVSDEAWAEANARAFESPPLRRDRTIKNPLAGLIVCGKCGRALIRQDVKNKYGKHYPRLHHAYNTPCQCKSVSVAYVIGRLVEALDGVADALEATAHEGDHGHSELDAIERALREEDRRLDKLMELYYADAITVDEFRVRREGFEARIAKMRARHDELTAERPDPVSVAVGVRAAISALGDEDLSPKEQNDALRAIIERIDYFELDRARRNRAIRLVVHLRGMQGSPQWGGVEGPQQ